MVVFEDLVKEVRGCREFKAHMRYLSDDDISKLISSNLNAASDLLMRAYVNFDLHAVRLLRVISVGKGH